MTEGLIALVYYTSLQSSAIGFWESNLQVHMYIMWNEPTLFCIQTTLFTKHVVQREAERGTYREGWCV